MKSSTKIYKSAGDKFGTCPKCGHRNGLNPFRFGGLSKATYEITSHKVIHHKCKKCLWQGYVVVNSESRVLNRLTDAAFYLIWIFLLAGIPVIVLAGIL